MTSTLLIATNNIGKHKEFQALLADLPLQLPSPADLGLHINVIEDGRTYVENAQKKAVTYAQASGLWALADDSGLEVDALHGQPGIYSARFASQPNASDKDRRSYLLQKLEPHPRPWAARFVCVVALANPEGEIFFAEGYCPGEIIPVERGQHGFGYDPIFLVAGMGRTMAELKTEEKNQLSHRARATQTIRPTLVEKLRL